MSNKRLIQRMILWFLKVLDNYGSSTFREPEPNVGELDSAPVKGITSRICF